SLRSGKNLRMEVDAGEASADTMTDPQRVRQIIINLLANAIKFTDEGEIMINVRATANEVQVAVRDTGIGIPAHAMKELFQDFHQLEAGDARRYDGTGAGLAPALGGEIEARSRQGEGSTFTLVLPRIPPQAQAQAGETVALLVPASTR